jgi:hypothetical protein
MFDSFIHNFLNALAVTIGTGIFGIILQTLKRLHLSLSAQNEAKLQTYVQQAIAYAEELIEAQLQRAGAKVADTASAKLDAAIHYLIAKVPGLTTTEAVKLITAGLGQSPFGASAPVK